MVRFTHYAFCRKLAGHGIVTSEVYMIYMDTVLYMYVCTG